MNNLISIETPEGIMTFDDLEEYADWLYLESGGTFCDCEIPGSCEGCQ